MLIYETHTSTATHPKIAILCEHKWEKIDLLELGPPGTKIKGEIYKEASTGKLYIVLQPLEI